MWLKRLTQRGSFDCGAVSYLAGCGGYTTLPMDRSRRGTIPYVHVPMAVSWF